MEQDPQHKISCGHGFKQELPAYRGVRLFEMNCGEIRCSLSESDYFGPDAALASLSRPAIDNIKEWIDDALLGKIDGWMEMDLEALETARKNPRQLAMKSAYERDWTCNVCNRKNKRNYIHEYSGESK